MKYKNIIKFTVASILMLGAVACATDQFEEISEIKLSRCLEPTNLSAKVNSSLGDVVTFSWDVAKGVDNYILTVYTDADLTAQYLTENLDPSQVPYQKKLEADKTYWFTVQATADGKKDSKVAAYDKSIKTYAVKDNLYLKVTARTANSISLAWSKDVADFGDVTHVEYAVTGSEETSKYDLTAEDKAAATATITGLAASKEYTVSLFYLSASRGQVDAWTTPDVTGFTEVSTLAALQNAVLTEDAQIVLKMAGSPYDIEAMDLSKGVTIVGEETADGTKPVLTGELHIADTWDGSDLYFEGVEFNGAPTATSPSGFGFAIQNKNGGAVADKNIGNITYKNCVICNYSKGLIYEWGKAMKLGEVTYDSCDIHDINSDGTGGGDVFDIRNATTIAKLSFVGNTIWQGMRTFIRIDAGTIDAFVFENNTLQNLSFVDNTNNAGIFGFQIVPGSFSFKNNLFLNMTGKAVLASSNAKYTPASGMTLTASNNWFYNLPKDDAGALTYFTDNFTMAQANGTILATDPCYNAPGGYYNIVADSEIAGKEVGAPKWWTPYVEEPEDLTQGVITEAHTWDLGNARDFSGTIKKQMVRDGLLVSASESCPIEAADGTLKFTVPTITDRNKVPSDGYLAFKVNAPGSVVIRAAGSAASHVIVATRPVAGGDLIVKGGVSPVADAPAPQKILISDITEESWVYIYSSGEIAVAQLAWSKDVSLVNTALPAPSPKATPSSFTAGEATDIKISWEAVTNAASYSVVFSGKTYAVDGLEYTIEGKTTSMLDAGSYEVSVFANPSDKDIYNTQSEAGIAAFAVLPKGGGEESTEFIVASVDDLLAAIAAGKDFITLKYSDTPYVLADPLTLVAPLHLSGQTSGDKKTAITASITLSGEIGGSVVFRNLDFVGSGASLLIEDKTTAAPVADTVAIYDSNIHGIKALYDNSGKAVSNVQYVIFKGNLITDSSAGADFIDMRTGASHNFVFENNTVANSCRTFVRTDAAHEMNSAVIRNNTFYKVATNSSSKDNNGIFHIRSAAGAGLNEYRVENNFFYSILIDTEPSNAAGFPKLRSKSGITPYTVANKYFYNCEDREGKEAYSFWANMTKEEGTAGGGAILPADPCKDAANGDFTLTNGVMMNAGVGDPRWNIMAGSTPSSEITVNDADGLLTAISAGKKVITLADGTYDLTAAATVLNAPLTLTGGKGAIVQGKFELGAGATSFTVKGITIDGNDALDNAFYVQDGAAVTSFTLSGVDVKNFKNRLFYQDKESSTVGSLVIDGALITGMGTSGDFIDVRKGGLTAVKVVNSTFANGIRTFARIDAAVVCGSILVQNNTFYNLCSVDSKDNNGIFHVRSTSVTDAKQVVVKDNLFAAMKKTADTPSNAQGFPKLVSKTSSTIFVPVFSHNYFYDVVTTENNLDTEYSWWAYSAQDVATAGYGVVLTADVFKDAAAGDFTIVHDLVASEKVGDPRWIKSAAPAGAAFNVNNVEELVTAITAGKDVIALAAGTYDLTKVDGASSGVVTLSKGVTLKGVAKNGIKPEVIGGIKLAATEGNFVLENLRLNGVYDNAGSEATVGNMIDIDASSVLGAMTLKDCEIYGYANRLISGSGESSMGPLTITGLLVHDFGTSGDFIDFRKGAVSSVKINNSTFYNGIRTFLRMDAGVKVGAVTVENNTFYNLCSVDSKDNNGIMHVRATTGVAPAALSAAARRILVRKNIFAAMKKAVDAPTQSNGFPKLVSKTSETIKHPYITDNIFFDIEATGTYSWWNTMAEEDITAAGTVLDETPFAGDPTTGKFTVKAAYKGYGDSRW